MLQNWYEEYLGSGKRPPFQDVDEEFIIYKGFKIIRSPEGYIILDVRRSDLYDPVREVDLKMFKDHGFVKGADIIMYQRDKIRCKKYKEAIEFLYLLRRQYKEELPGSKRVAFVKKKIRNINKNIHDNADSIFFYQTRMKQVKEEYNLI